MGWRSGAGSAAGEDPADEPVVPGGPGPSGGPGCSGAPDGAPRDERLAGFAPGGRWDQHPPGPELAEALAAIVGPDRHCPGASDQELVGALRRAAAQESHAAAVRLALVRELIRRDPAPPPGRTFHGDLPDQWSESVTYEIALALACSVTSANNIALVAWELEARLPGIGALLEDGVLAYPKARLVTEVFALLSDADAARAEALLIPYLIKNPGLTFAQLANLANRIATQVDPTLAERRRKGAVKHASRVQMFREESGAAALCGRDLPPDEVLAANAKVNARAARYKASGAFKSARMDQLRSVAYLDILNGREAETRIALGYLSTDPEYDDCPISDAPLDDHPGYGFPDDDAPDDVTPDDVTPDGGVPDDVAPGEDGLDDGEPGGASLVGTDGPGLGAQGYDAPDGDTPGGSSPDDAGPDYVGPDSDDGGAPDDGEPGGAAPPGGDGPRPGSPSNGGSRPGDDSGETRLPRERHPGPGGPGPGGTGIKGPGPGGASDGGSAPGERPALTDLVIPLATLLGLAERPGEAHGLGVLDPALCRDLAALAAASPHTRICLTVTDPDGVTTGHGCVRTGRSAERPASAPAGASLGLLRSGAPPGVSLPARLNLTITADRLSALLAVIPARPLAGGWPAAGWGLARAGTAGITGGAGGTGGAQDRESRPGDPAWCGTWALALPDGRTLTVRIGPVATHTCDHRTESHAYQPNGTLRHHIVIRDRVCTFPTCNRHAKDSDFEHCVPYDQGGRTCSCNAGARSRKCHRVKQSKGWTVTQPKPAWHAWTTPSGWTYTQTPYQYPV